MNFQEFRVYDHELGWHLDLDAWAASYSKWYIDLGVAEDASFDQIIVAYHNAIKIFHPDLFQQESDGLKKFSENATKKINKAYAEARNIKKY